MLRDEFLLDGALTPTLLDIKNMDFALQGGDSTGLDLDDLILIAKNDDDDDDDDDIFVQTPRDFPSAEAAEAVEAAEAQTDSNLVSVVSASPPRIVDYGSYVSVISHKPWGESRQDVLKLEPRKKPTKIQLSAWMTERKAGVFTLDNAHMWPHLKRNELFSMHGFNAQNPRRNDPWARGPFGAHGRINAQGRFACGHCTTTCSTKVNLRDHMNIHRQNKRFKCRFCDKTFTNHGNRIAHEKSSLPGHLAIKTARCTVCSKAFAHGAALRAHMLKHTKAPPPSSFSCDYCSKSYANAPNANRHMRLKHPMKYMTRINVCRKRKRFTEVALVTTDRRAASLAVVAPTRRRKTREALEALDAREAREAREAIMQV